MVWRFHAIDATLSPWPRRNITHWLISAQVGTLRSQVEEVDALDALHAAPDVDCPHGQPARLQQLRVDGADLEQRRRPRAAAATAAARWPRRAAAAAAAGGARVAAAPRTPRRRRTRSTQRDVEWSAVLSADASW